MFDRIRRSRRPTSRADRLKAAVATGAAVHAGKTATQLAGHAKTTAGGVKEWATPHVGAAVDWTSPRVEKAWRESQRVAAPKVERAAEKAVPLVDNAHDRFVDDVLPKFVAAVTAAGVAAAAGADKARDVTSARLNELAHIEVPEPKKSHKLAKVFWLLAGLAAIGAAFAAWRQSQPTSDPWAEQPWDADAAGSASTSPDVREVTGDAAEPVGAGTSSDASTKSPRRRADTPVDVTPADVAASTEATSGSGTTSTEGTTSDADTTAQIPPSEPTDR